MLNPPDALALWCQKSLNDLSQNHLLRTRSLGPSECLNQGLDFASNDYLGFAQGALRLKGPSTDTYYLGSGASPLVSGYTSVHQNLEEACADFLGFESSLLVHSGFSANQGVLQTLLSPNDIVFADRLNHASLIDGVLASKSRMIRYKHLDVEHLESLLIQQAKKKLQQTIAQESNTWIVTDGVFSMDGDWAPLPALVKLAKQYNAHLFVDDAHGFGVIGDKGRGICEATGVNPKDIDIHVVTCGKAIGANGAFVLAQAPVIGYLIQKMRHYVYSTGVSQWHAALLHDRLKALQNSNHLRQLLCERSMYLRQQLLHLSKQLGLEHLQRNEILNAQNITNHWHPITPFIIGDNQRLLAIAQRLREDFIHVGAIRPPTVPQGTARLRISITSDHTHEMIDQLIEVLASALREVQ